MRPEPRGQQPALRPVLHSGQRPEPLVPELRALREPQPEPQLGPVPELLVRRLCHSFAFSSFRFSVYILMYVWGRASSIKAIILFPTFLAPSLKAVS